MIPVSLDNMAAVPQMAVTNSHATEQVEGKCVHSSSVSSASVSSPLPVVQSMDLMWNVLLNHTASLQAVDINDGNLMYDNRPARKKNNDMTSARPTTPLT